MSSVAQILRKAEELKSTISDPGVAQAEAWVARQNLQDVYQSLLVSDLEFALDKKVEQDLWNHVFKNQINAMQVQMKEKQLTKKSEMQASLNLFLETASGFYLQLIQELCSAFKLDLPFRRRTTFYGALEELTPTNNSIKIPKHSSCLYICQHCLVHLGDIARYRQQSEQAQTFYRHAANLVPYNGQPYNQLAIIEATKGNKLSVVFYYVRSIAVKHPFPVAATNLEKFYVKLSKDTCESSLKLTITDMIITVLQFNALIHTVSNLSLAKKLSEKIILCLPSHVMSMSFTTYKLVQVLAICLFSLSHVTTKLENKLKQDKPSEGVVKAIEKAKHLIFSFIVSLLDNLLHHTPKQENKAKEYFTLPTVKLILDWLRFDRHSLSDPLFKGSTIWANMSKLLNNLQFHSQSKDNPFDPNKYSKTPLPEDYDLQGFLPLADSQSLLKFGGGGADDMSPDIEVKLRCHRLVEYGKQLCEDFPSLNLINYQTLKSQKMQFRAPTAHVKLMQTGVENEAPSPGQKLNKQNVAIQAIIQKRTGQNEKSSETTPQIVVQKRVNQKENVSEQSKSQPSSSGEETPFLAVIKKKAGETTTSTNRTPQAVLLKKSNQKEKTADKAPVQAVLLKKSSQKDKTADKSPSQIHSGKSNQVPSDSHKHSVSTSTSIGTNPPQTQDIRPSLGHPVMPYNIPPPGHQNQQVFRAEHGYRASLQGVPPPYLPQQRVTMETGHHLHQQQYPLPATSMTPQQHVGMTMPSQFALGMTPRPSVPVTFTSPPPQALPRPMFTRGMPPPVLPPHFMQGGDVQHQMNALSTKPAGGAFLHAPGSELHTHHPLHSIMSPPKPTWMNEGMPPSPTWMTDSANMRMESRDVSALFPNLPGKEEFSQEEPELRMQASSFTKQTPGDLGSGGDSSSLFSDPAESSGYSLFRQSPWAVQLSTTPESKSHTSSPFSSHSGSQRNTPIDLMTHQSLDGSHHRSPSLNYSGYGSDNQWPTPVNQVQKADGTNNVNTLLSSNIQNLWSSGPSPLERLLEQQKHHRQTDPH